MADGDGASLGGGNQQLLSTILNTNIILSQILQALTTALPTVQTTSTTVGAAGGASALPATPLGYYNATLPNGTRVKIPYYNP